MSNKKTLSRDEKLTKLLEVFHETKEFYTLKEVEKMGREKGLISNQIKEILQTLVDDGQVDSEKIGQSLYYWAFPSKTLKLKQKQFAELMGNSKALNDKLSTLETALQEKHTTQNDIDKLKRAQLVNEIASMQEKEKNFSEIMKQHKENDPDKIQKLNKETKDLLDAANRWTDNIFQTKSWCKKKFNIEEDKLNKQFEIPEDLDYIE